MTDQDIVQSAVKQAEDVLRAYIQPRQKRDCSQTMNRLLAILDNEQLVAALRRIDQSVQISATIGGTPVVETVNGEEAAFRRAQELRADGAQFLQVIMPDGTVLQADDVPSLINADR